MFQVESVSDRLICKNSFWEGLTQYPAVGTNRVSTDRVVVRLIVWIER